MFDYKRLPAEIRLKIIPPLLEPKPNKGVPDILVAISKDPELYGEAQQLYRKINVVISSDSQAEFRKVKMVDLLKIRCIKLIMQPVQMFGLTVDLAANKCMLRNNFQSLIFECSITGTDNYWIELTRYLSSASQCGISKVVAILSPAWNTSTPRYIHGVITREEAIERADWHIGVKSTCVMFGDKEIWTWEKEDGGVLDIGASTRERDRGRDTGDIGIRNGEGLKRMSSMTRALAMRNRAS